MIYRIKIEGKECNDNYTFETPREGDILDAIGTAHHPKPSSASLQRGMPTVRVFRQRVGRRFPH